MGKKIVLYLILNTENSISMTGQFKGWIFIDRIGLQSPVFKPPTTPLQTSRKTDVTLYFLNPVYLMRQNTHSMKGIRPKFQMVYI